MPKMVGKTKGTGPARDKMSSVGSSGKCYGGPKMSSVGASGHGRSSGGPKLGSYNPHAGSTPFDALLNTGVPKGQSKK